MQLQNVAVEKERSLEDESAPPTTLQEPAPWNPEVPNSQ
jgi:hypothetical protein